MEIVGASEARARFSALLDRVARGEAITITRNGVPAAKLVPIGSPEHRLSHKETVEGMRALRKRVKPDRMSVREMIEAGKRF
jgi:prevent-host-death family protein